MKKVDLMLNLGQVRQINVIEWHRDDNLLGWACEFIQQLKMKKVRGFCGLILVKHQYFL